MQLTKIHQIDGEIELLSGLHIGGEDSEMHIGGTDNPIIRNPITKSPYIPGSSLKGKIRSLLEWRSGAVQSSALSWERYQEYKQQAQIAQRILEILKLFGVSGDTSKKLESADKDKKAEFEAIGPTRLAFHDCKLLTTNIRPELKMETAIDRISGTAKNSSLRTTERVPAGARFEFRLSLKVLDGEDLLPTVLAGLKLLELDSLGGSGSRGYGKIRFDRLTVDGQEQALPADPFQD